VISGTRFVTGIRSSDRTGVTQAHKTGRITKNIGLYGIIAVIVI